MNKLLNKAIGISFNNNYKNLLSSKFILFISSNNPALFNLIILIKQLLNKLKKKIINAEINLER